MTDYAHVVDQNEAPEANLFWYPSYLKRAERIDPREIRKGDEVLVKGPSDWSARGIVDVPLSGRWVALRGFSSFIPTEGHACYLIDRPKPKHKGALIHWSEVRVGDDISVVYPSGNEGGQTVSKVSETGFTSDYGTHCGVDIDYYGNDVYLRHRPQGHPLVGEIESVGTPGHIVKVTDWAQSPRCLQNEVKAPKYVIYTVTNGSRQWHEWDNQAKLTRGRVDITRLFAGVEVELAPKA